MKLILVISVITLVHLIVSDAKPAGGGLNLDGVGAHATSVGAQLTQTALGKGTGTGSSAVKTITDSGTSVTKKVTDTGTGAVAETGDGGVANLAHAAETGTGAKKAVGQVGMDAMPMPMADPPAAPGAQ